MSSIIVKYLTGTFFIVDDQLNVTQGSRENATGFTSPEEAFKTIKKAAKIQIKRHLEENIAIGHESSKSWIRNFDDMRIKEFHQFYPCENRLDTQDLAASFDLYYIRSNHLWLCQNQNDVLSVESNFNPKPTFEKNFADAIGFTDIHRAKQILKYYKARGHSDLVILKASAQFTEYDMEHSPNHKPDEVDEAILTGIEARTLQEYVESSLKTASIVDSKPSRRGL